MLPLPRSEDGFTLIELLVVILIVGVLAAIALPLLLGQGDKARDVGAKAEARNGVSQLEACIADAEPAEVEASCSEARLRPVLGGATVGDVRADAYVVQAGSDTGGVFRIEKLGPGRFDRSCSGTSRGCRGGSW